MFFVCLFFFVFFGNQLEFLTAVFAVHIESAVFGAAMPTDPYSYSMIRKFRFAVRTDVAIGRHRLAARLTDLILTEFFIHDLIEHFIPIPASFFKVFHDIAVFPRL